MIDNKLKILAYFYSTKPNFSLMLKFQEKKYKYQAQSQQFTTTILDSQYTSNIFMDYLIFIKVTPSAVSPLA